MLPDPLPGRSFFDEVYRDRAPWDIEAPQPELMRLVEEFPPRGRILDVGCGTGDLAIGLAELGHAVLGVDFVPSAIEVARTRARALAADRQRLVEFRVGDALRLSRFAGEIGSVVDSGFFHLFDGPTRAELVGELAAVLRSGGRYLMLGFAITFPIPNSPRAVTPDEIAALFSKEGGWLVNAARAARFRTHGFDDVPAIAVCAQRLA
jgi:SAM-dependent methyltransferase